MAEPAGAGLDVASPVHPSAHTDFDPGERESLANTQRLPCTLLTSTVLLLGTPRQRDTAARGQHSSTQYSCYIHKTLLRVRDTRMTKCSLRVCCVCMWYIITMCVWVSSLITSINCSVQTCCPVPQQTDSDVCTKVVPVGHLTCHWGQPLRPQGVRWTAGRACWSSAAARLSDGPPPLPGPPGSQSLPGWLCAAGDSAGPTPRCTPCCYLQTHAHTFIFPFQCKC